MRSFVLTCLCAVVVAASAGAQRPDTTRRGADTTRRGVDTTHVPVADSLKPPISPRRAFFYSFLAPGYAQTVLGRHRAAAAFVFVEAMCVAMIRESGADAHEARRMQNDTTVVSYVNPPSIPPGDMFGHNEVASRESHVEDWVALLVANHLFAGADAFVAANLWDVPARLAIRVVPVGGRTGPFGGAAVTASLRW